VLAVDDVPRELASPTDRERYASLAEAHVDLVHWLRAQLDPGIALWLVPTDYLGTGSTPYLDALGQELAPEIEVMWTGRTVLSPSIEPDEAASRARALRRRVLVWDNYPVGDGPMRNMLHLGPYLGRSAALASHTSGFLLNPMQHARASALALCTAAEFLRDPARYDPEAAWQRALRELGGDAADSLELFARAHRVTPLAPDDRDTALEGAMARFSEALGAGEDLAPLLDPLRGLIDARLAAPEKLRAGLADARLRAELEPWLAGHEIETRRMDEALRALGVLLGPGSASDKVAAFSRMEGRLTRLCPPLATSYGPRRVLYPQLVDMTARGMRFGSDPTLLRGRNLADEWIELVEDLALWILVEPP
jgi:hyaluronoglucosaminidase